jgi:Uma2 family endonuclease
MAVTPRSLTLEEFLELPECKPALEFHPDGVVRQKLAPKGRHSVLQSSLVMFFNVPGLQSKTARAFPELRTTYGGASHVPDVAVYRWERIPRSPSGEVADEFFEPPDVAIEIVSPKQSRRKLRDQCQWYVDHGAGASLLVDPRDYSIVLFLPSLPPRRLLGTDEIDFGAVIPGLRLVVQDLFDSLRL